jgi:type I restriction enzyme S subunit
MIADLKPYPEYKESGLPWLGRVPSHWKYRRTKFLFRERVTKGFPNEPLLAATQTKGVVKKTDYGERTVTAMKDFHLLKLVMPGDFVISLRSFEGGIEIAHCRGIISPAYTVLEPRNEVRRNFYRHFFKSPDFIRNLTLFVTGIREGQNIDYERLSRAYMPLPPEAEQEQIGRFLDWANGRLERAIRAKRKVIALLHEQKQAIIHKAVTQGLDPNVPKRDSGIPWLGEIPAHWEVSRIGQKTQIMRGRFSHRPRNAPQFYGGRYPFIQTGDMSAADKLITRYSQTLNERGLAISKMFPAGTLAMVLTGAKTGHVAILTFDACFPDSAVGFCPSSAEVNKVYLYYLLLALKGELERASITSTQENLNVQRIRSQVAAWPSLACDNALRKVMQGLLRDDTQTYRQFVENESFRRGVSDLIFELTRG